MMIFKINLIKEKKFTSDDISKYIVKIYHIPLEFLSDRENYFTFSVIIFLPRRKSIDMIVSN